MQFVSLNGVTIHYQIIGAPEGKPLLVFANSLGTDFRIWRDVIVRLAGDFAIVTYDKRGHGLSDIGETPYSMDDHVTDLEALLDHLGVRNAIVCGLSVGGLIAQGLYARRRDLVRALILCDTAHKIGTDELWNARIQAVREGGIEAIADGVLERWFTAKFRAADNPDFAGYRNMLVRTPVDGYAATSVAIRDTDYTEQARQIGVPAICIVGEDDKATPPDLMLETAKLIPAARYEVIAKAGHLPCIEQPEMLVDIMRAFIADMERGGADD
ncbi:3-oxoadipate enol-lactonase [Oricola cellulosilytica]|uniref:3-oxoadipate enol-lactonase n=1 Tax=Oricola cellulosilytica TaxID=1429082 RepID=A0A4R0P5P1_9HYPH|nr:3-oxoadipate enol-lactonase [Oricola cellulosilytica]TCD11937.1 3-oxoadipate enol-lactonase [Oricola cellulosilytica]